MRYHYWVETSHFNKGTNWKGTEEQIKSPEVDPKHEEGSKFHHNDEVKGSLIGDSLIVEQVPVESQESVQLHQTKTLKDNDIAQILQEVHHRAETSKETKIFNKANQQLHDDCDQVVAETVDGDQMNWL